MLYIQINSLTSLRVNIFQYLPVTAFSLNKYPYAAREKCQKTLFIEYTNLCPAMLSDVLLGGISRDYPTEGVHVLQLLQVILVYHCEGSREELTEGAVQIMVLRDTLPSQAAHAVEQVQFN